MLVEIKNTDNFESRQAEIITHSNNDLRWCIAVSDAPKYGRTEITGEGKRWQIVRANKNGTYTYNNSMYGGFGNNLDDVKAIASRSGYDLI